MRNLVRSQPASRLLFASIGMAACLLTAALGELLFARVDMQGLLADQSARSLLFDVGAVRRSTRDRLKSGDIQITLQWGNRNDLDLACRDPSGELIFYNHRRSASGGELDFDMNADDRLVSTDAVENIHWPSNSAPRGRYRVYVSCFKQREMFAPTPFSGTVLFDGQRKAFRGSTVPEERRKLVAEFTITHDPRSFLGMRPGAFFAAAVTGLWFSLLAAALATALILAENPWYRRHYGKPVLGVALAARRVGKLLGVSFAIAAVAQILFGLLAPALSPEILVILRLICWTACFGLVGRALSRAAPNMSSTSAPLAGLVSGWIAGVGFLFAAMADREPVARLGGAALVGAALGVLICLLWQEDEAPPAVGRTPMLALPPMRLQPYRMTIYDAETGNSKPPEREPPSVRRSPPRHEKPG